MCYIYMLSPALLRKEIKKSKIITVFAEGTVSMVKAHVKIPYIVYIMLTVLLCFLLSRFCFQLALVQGESMEPTLRGGQFVFVNRLDKGYARGDIVLLRSDSLGADVVKRIAAMPGDTIYIDGGTVFVNGKPYLPYPGCGSCEYAGLAGRPLTVPEGKCFLLGDNFSRSSDSRHEELGLVDIADITGKIK